ncbi:MAG: 16S rRNA (guanine(527)-N(7))-methyltransferase RsmG [Spirochaetes bacterium]|nr:16S rRNA (guanine(527)-N(7))-methyltransferase RsmG [Spirochaetota bacterium]
MEHEVLKVWCEKFGVRPEDDKCRLLLKYSNMIYRHEGFNITGLKNADEILKTLVLGSLEPFLRLNVPRGTSFIDIGTGAGIPGIPLAIFFPEFRGFLLDSNAKKIGFINNAADELGLRSVTAVCGRAEDIGRDGDCRESFDFVFMRAFGSLYISVELGAPFCKPGGMVYVYSSGDSADKCAEIMQHLSALGLHHLPGVAHKDAGLDDSGTVFKKISETGTMYPRRYAIIKRDSSKYTKKK